MVHLLHRLYGVDAPGCGHKYRRLWNTRNWEPWNSALLGGVADPKIHAPTPYVTNFGSSAAKGVHINIKEPQIGERWGPTP